MSALRSCLERIDAREGEIRAFAWLDRDRAERRGREIEETIAADAPLRGMPLGIKDVIDVAGMPTGMGSPLFEGRVADESADLVLALERAGALILGKTVTAELAYFCPGPTRNPWNTAHTPGGSSSGSAAAVAAGFVVAAIGTQTNGSVIRPAAFCGVAGFKPSRGRVSTRGVLSWSPTLDQPGVFARTIDDCALLFRCLDTHRSEGVAPAPAHPRLALVRSPVWHLAEEPQCTAIAATAEKLRRAGAEVEEAELPSRFGGAHAAHAIIMDYEGARFFADLQRRHRAELSNQLNRMIDRGAAIGESEYGDARALRLELQAELARFCGDVDAILTPPARGEAPPTLSTTGDPTFCTIWTLCAVPAVNLPIGFGPRGLPLGVQLVGGLDDDDALLDLAAWCEARSAER